MPEWNVGDPSLRYLDGGTRLAATAGVNISGGNLNTKNAAWTTVVASTEFQSGNLFIYVQNRGIATEALIDFAVGSAGNEVVFATNIGFHGKSFDAHSPYVFPLAIPAGTRISAKMQANATNAGLDVLVGYAGTSFLSTPSCGGRLVTYGFNEADSGGTSVDPGGTANTKGGWSVITSATADRIRKLSLFFGGQGNSARTDCYWLVDVGIGGTGSERILIPNISLASSTQRDVIIPMLVGPFDVNIPEGTQISVRAQCSINDASDRLFDVILYGVC